MFNLKAHSTRRRMSKPRYEIVVIGEMDSPDDAMRSLLHTTMKHCAEFQVKMLEVISEKYGHSVEDMIDVIRSHEKFSPRALVVDPYLAELLEVKAPPDTPAAVVADAAADGKEKLKTKKGKKVIVKKSQ
jgi:hypothetical protein